MLTEKLLIVDDIGQLRKLLRLTLGYGIYNMYEADNGKDALELARTITPDVMVLDVMLPGGLDGFQICEEIKSDPKLKAIFVVLLTARGQKEDIEKGKQVGADSYIVKPFSPAHLIEIIESRKRKPKILS
jgi:CheY-like chemotaxis protein